VFAVSALLFKCKKGVYIYIYMCVCMCGRSGDRIPVGARFSAPVQTGPGAHPASCTMSTGSLPRVKRPGHGVDYPPHLVPRLKKEYSYISTPLWSLVACSRVNFTFLPLCVYWWCTKSLKFHLVRPAKRLENPWF
jgi:hypothetical protein